MDTKDQALAIADAVRTGDAGLVRGMLQRKPDLVCSDSGTGPLLGVAARRGRLEILRLLIELGADVNARSKFGEYVISDAIMGDNPGVLRALLEHGADVARADQSNRLVIASITGSKKHSLEMVKLLEQYGADFHRVFLNQLANEPMNALSTAIDWDKHDVADYLRSKGAVMPDASPDKEQPQTRGDEVVAYFCKHFGPVKRQALIEIVPTAWPAIAVHVVPSAQERPFVTLFTTGMSSEEMKVPEGEEIFRFGEVFVQLPADWQYDKIADPKYAWPLEWLRTSAQHAHTEQTWLGAVTTIANNDPPTPLGPNTPFTAVLLLAEKTFVTHDGRTIQLYRMVPLCTEELQLALTQGAPALMRAFDRHHVPFIVKVDRPNVGLLEGGR
jgi:hypothetical protein